MATWQVQQAKARFSEVIDSAKTEGPQTISRHGAEQAVVISMDDYRAMTSEADAFKRHLLSGPKFDSFTIPRSRDTGRRIRL